MAVQMEREFFWLQLMGYLNFGTFEYFSIAFCFDSVGWKSHLTSNFAPGGLQVSREDLQELGLTHGD